MLFLTQDTITAVTLRDYVDIVIRNDRWPATWLRASRSIPIWGKRLAASSPKGIKPYRSLIQ
jgi:hypothetical protein